MARVSGSSGVSESSIVFYNGGHNHDGISSSLIDTDEYSLYDWTVGYVGAGSRLSRQEANFDALKNFKVVPLWHFSHGKDENYKRSLEISNYLKNKDNVFKGF